MKSNGCSECIHECQCKRRCIGMHGTYLRFWSNIFFWSKHFVPSVPTMQCLVKWCTLLSDKMSSGICPSPFVLVSWQWLLPLVCVHALMQVFWGNYSICWEFFWLFFIYTWSPLQKTNYRGEYKISKTNLLFYCKKWNRDESRSGFSFVHLLMKHIMRE